MISTKHTQYQENVNKSKCKSDSRVIGGREPPVQAAQRHGVPLAGRAAAALAARPAQRARPEERALLVAGLRALRGQHAGRAAQRVQRPHARAPAPPAPPHHLNLAGARALARDSLTSAGPPLLRARPSIPAPHRHDPPSQPQPTGLDKTTLTYILIIIKLTNA